jgi:flagellar basal-body rod protein FlgF
MPYGLYISAEGAQVQNKRLEVIANNLANVNTVAFKRQLAVAQARYAEETRQGRDYPGSGSINDVGGGVQVRETKTELRPGSLKPTGVPHNLAINGEGYFRVRRGGETFLTRAGNFTVDPNGQLVTPQGFPLLSEDGEPVVVGEEFNVTPNGSIEQDGGITARLSLVRPNDVNELRQAGENLFSTSTPNSVTPLADTERHVVSGYLEMSGVSPVTEMMEMIFASRAYEANVRMIQHQDQMLGNLVNRVLRQS